ncbi:hypothetical protein [Streptomyces sp. NPDC054854]
MAHWEILVQYIRTDGTYIETVTTVQGSRDDAQAALDRAARTFRPSSMLREKGRRIYRHSDGVSYYVRITGSFSTSHLLFSSVELVQSIGAPQPALASDLPPE